MSEAEILSGLAEAFREAAIPSVPMIVPTLAFDEIAGLDSVSRARFIMSVEERFEIEISSRENGRLRTIEDLFNLVSKKMSDR